MDILAKTASVPRLAGGRLKVVSALMRAPVSGPPLRRKLGSMVIEEKLAAIDFAAEGEPAPLYMPPSYRR
jgi:hypothetical protein